jgi:hypothetical protein
MRYRRALAVISLAGLTSCTGGVPGVLRPKHDPYAAVRQQFVATELARTEFPQGAIIEGAYGDTSATGLNSGLTSIIVPDSYGVQNVVDFYLQLFARQHHAHIIVACNVQSHGNDYTIDAVGWNGKYGYLINIGIARADSELVRLKRKYATPGTKEILVVMNLVSNPAMPVPTNEVPIHECPYYPLARMAKVLQPYGLRPYAVSQNWDDYPYTPNGSPNTDHKRPPPITWPVTASTSAK